MVVQLLLKSAMTLDVSACHLPVERCGKSCTAQTPVSLCFIVSPFISPFLSSLKKIMSSQIFPDKNVLGCNSWGGVVELYMSHIHAFNWTTGKILVRMDRPKIFIFLDPVCYGKKYSNLFITISKSKTINKKENLMFETRNECMRLCGENKQCLPEPLPPLYLLQTGRSRLSGVVLLRE